MKTRTEIIISPCSKYIATGRTVGGQYAVEIFLFDPKPNNRMSPLIFFRKRFPGNSYIVSWLEEGIRVNGYHKDRDKNGEKFVVHDSYLIKDKLINDSAKLE